MKQLKGKFIVDNHPILHGKRVYLSSPMEQMPNKEDWAIERKGIIKTLEGNFSLKVFDPYTDPKQGYYSEIVEARHNQDFDKVTEIAKAFVAKDLNLVNWADILIAYVPRGIPMCGVTHEVINANAGKKLVLLVEGRSKSNISVWYYGFIKYRFMFGRWDELYEFLHAINRGDHKEDSRLQFLYNYPSEWLS